MKFHPLFVIISFAFLYSSCKKKVDVLQTPSNTAVDVDSIYKTTSIPPVAGYAGTLIAKAIYGCAPGAPDPETDSDVSFIYTVTNINNDTLIFAVQAPIILSGFHNPLSPGGAVKKTAQNSYEINMSDGYFTFAIVNDSLYVSGYYSDQYFDYCASANVRFAGRLKPYDTANAQHR